VSERTDPTSEGHKAERRPYEPPRLGEVDLEAEEVLGLGCKMVTGGVSAAVACPISACTTSRAS
jgi:hypothetical protein